VKAYFPESTRREITQMVGHIKDEFALRLRANRWLDEPTRKAALEKLSSWTWQVGYPEQVDRFQRRRHPPDDYFGNVRRVDRFLQARALAKLGKPVVIERFDDPSARRPIGQCRLQPATQQRRHHGSHRPAAVLCARRRRGGELLHHRRGDRPRTDAWLRQPRAPVRPRRQPARLVDAAGHGEIHAAHRCAGRSVQPVPDTAGPDAQRPADVDRENTADLGGITLAHAALQRHLKPNPLPKIDGLSSDQRCFVAWSQMWAYKARSERLRLLVSLDVPRHQFGACRRAAGAPGRLPQSLWHP
jgi:putative endopeptidase